jgi:hypothetical protein
LFVKSSQKDRKKVCKEFSKFLRTLDFGPRRSLKENLHTKDEMEKGEEEIEG